MHDWPMRRKMYIYPSLVSGTERLLDMIRMEHARLEAAYGRTPGMAGDGGGGSGPGDPCGSLVADLVDPLQERIAALAHRYAEQMSVIAEVEGYLQSLDALEVRLMDLRYLRRLPWDQICTIESYSRTTAHRIHCSAVSKCKGQFF